MGAEFAQRLGSLLALWLATGIAAVAAIHLLTRKK